MEQSFDFTVLIALALVAGIGAQVLATFLKVPGIVFLLLFGILLGTDGLRVLQPQTLGVGLEVLVSLAVALILFEGGLNLRIQELSQVSRSLRNLVTIGAGITLMGGAMAAHYLSEFPWPLAFLYGSMVVVTGPTVINPILKRVRLESSVSTLLEGEGVLIDPIGAILAVVVLQVVSSGQTDLIGAAEQLGERLLVGAAIGAVAGWLMGMFLLWSRQYLTEELRNSVVLAGALGVFILAQSLLSESGLMAVVLAGLVMRQRAAIAERSVRQFHGQLVVLAISVLFILLTSSLSIKAVLALGWGSVATVAILMLVVRPLSVLLCTWNSDLTWRQKIFVAWVAPRGIVAASVASLFAILLTERGISGGDALKSLVFLTIAMTVVIQGLTAAWVAQWLELEQGAGMVIIGDHPLTQRLAKLLRSQGQSVQLVSLLSSSSDPSSMEEATPDPKATLAVSAASTHGTVDLASGNGRLDPIFSEVKSAGMGNSRDPLNPQMDSMDSSDDSDEERATAAQPAARDPEVNGTASHNAQSAQDPKPNNPRASRPSLLEMMEMELRPDEILSESVLLQADIEHADTLLIMTLNPQVNWAIAELSIKLFASATIWTSLLPNMPASEGIRPLHNPFEQIQRWADYLDSDSAQLRSLTLPMMADLGLKQGRLSSKDWPAMDWGFSAYAGLGDLTFERIRDQFTARIESDACLPLLLLRPQRMRWPNKGDSYRAFLMPEPELWHRGDQVFYLERSAASPLSLSSLQDPLSPLDDIESTMVKIGGSPKYTDIKLHFDL
ncbi:MAG: sodium:proton antiporter [Synechococcaceae cyanobacterium SM2_3_2]|nr:sodium:proton antiporter [Synechococcaceae cyanobacterium SM2_3_2]